MICFISATTPWILYAYNATVSGPPCPLLGSGSSSSLAACQASCDANPNCNGMNFSPTTPGCYLRQCPNYSPAVNAYSGYNVWLKIPPGKSVYFIMISHIQLLFSRAIACIVFLYFKFVFEEKRLSYIVTVWINLLNEMLLF